MAGLEFRGIDDLKRDLARMTVAAENALEDAQDAAAKVFRKAIREAAPIGKGAYPYRRRGKVRMLKSRRPIGQLQASVKVEIMKDRQALSGTSRQRVMAGPEKKKGYYGFWLEEGWLMPVATATYTIPRGNRWHAAGHTYVTKRRKRPRSKTTSSQMGTEKVKSIPATRWFSRAVAGAEAEAAQAARRAFEETMNEEASRTS